jgi:hypothetical protein
MMRIDRPLPFLAALFVATMLTRQATADVVVDGEITGDGYGAPVAVQSVNTGFGDNDGFSQGSELNAAYARIEGGMLHVALTGNLEDNFNKLVLFFDSKAGGQNALDSDTNSFGSNPVVDQSPFPGDPGMFQKMTAGGATTFDSGFFADYVLVLRHGFTGSDNRFDVDFGVLGGAASQYLGVFDPTMATGGSTGVGANASPISIGLNNSNVAGVVAGNGAADSSAATSVTTGIELSLSLADLGNPLIGDNIKITAYITNSNHDYVSNQFLGGLPAPIENLGSDGIAPPLHFPGETYFNLNDYAGNQYFTVAVVPEAGAGLFGAVAASVAAFGLVVRRARRS